MVGVFLGMKWRLLRNSLRGAQLATTVVGGLFGLGLAAVSPVVAAATSDATTAANLLSVGYAVWLIGWLLAPLVTGRSDETLRPEHFTLLPIGRGRLAVGLLAASLLGVPAMVSFIAFTATTVYGLRFGPAAALLGAVFTVAQLLTVVLFYRVVMTALGTLLHSRKGRELGGILTSVFTVSIVGLGFMVDNTVPASMEHAASDVAGVLRALPSGWGPVAVEAAGRSEWTVAVLLLLALLTLLVVLTLTWAALLNRNTTRAQFRGQGGVLARSARQPRGRSLLPDTAVGAVASKELRTWWRDNRRRVLFLSTVPVGVLVSLNAAVPTAGIAGLPYVSLAIVVFGSEGNLYGFDGSALWHTLVTPGGQRADVRGRQLAWALIVGPISLVFALVLPAIVSPAAYPWVLALLPALLGAGSGVLLLRSVFALIPLPDPRRDASPFARGGGAPGGSRALRQLGIWLLLIPSAVPVAAILTVGTVADLAILRWLSVPIGIATGTALAWWWGEVATRKLTRDGPELLQLLRNQSSTGASQGLGKQSFLSS